VTRFAALSVPDIEDAAALGGGRFVVVGTSIEHSSASGYVRAFDADGRSLWTSNEPFDRSKPSSLLHPSAIAVATDGTVAVVDSIRHTLQRFGSDGAFKDCIDLASAWGRQPRFPISVRADVDGGVIVFDQDGDPPLYRMGRDGTVRDKLSVRARDGVAMKSLARTARVAPEGKLWATDGQRLLRLDDQGVVDLEIGECEELDVLAATGATAIDVFGRVLAQDRATGVVHVFDGKGRKLFVCRPEPHEMDDPNLIGHLAATPDRGVIAWSTAKNAYARFAPDGSRHGEIEARERIWQPVFSPRNGAVYACGPQKCVVELDADFQPRAKIERAPDGTWLENQDGPAIAPDGAVALLDAASARGSKTGVALILYETGDLATGRSIALPDDVRYFRVALGRTWAVLAGFNNDALLVHRSDGKLTRFAVPGVDEDKGKWCFGVDPDHEELVAFDSRARRLHRFALP
jgi:hypothetical protein